MADIDVQQKSGPGIWPWIIGLVVLALLAWLVAEWLGEDDEVVAPVAEAPVVAPPVAAPVTEAPPATAAAAGIPAAQIVANPASWEGRTVSGTAQVTEVPTDRGFWIEADGQRLFVILRDAPAEQPMNVQQGQTVRITEATVHIGAAGVAGDLDPDTRGIVQNQPALLTVDEDNLQVVQAAGS